MTTSNAQAALQAAVKMTIAGGNNTEVMINRANAAFEWLEAHTAVKVLPTVVELSPFDRQLLRDLKPRPTFPVTSHKGSGF